MNSKEALKLAREIRTKEGKSCVLEYDVYGNRHSFDCPCYTLANKILLAEKLLDKK